MGIPETIAKILHTGYDALIRTLRPGDALRCIPGFDPQPLMR
jgi:hypothetical protein